MSFMAAPLRKNTPQIRSPIDWDGSRSVLKDCFFRTNFLYFPIESYYFEPGSLRKSPGDLREHFLKISSLSGTYILFISPNYVRKVAAIFSQKAVILPTSSGKIICQRIIFRPHSGNFPNEVGKPFPAN